MQNDNRRCQDQFLLHREDTLERLPPLAAITSCRCGQPIYGREDPAEHWYRVVSGAAPRFLVQSNGRRQIVDFLLPGDFFDFAAQKEQGYDAEAVMDGTVVACYPRRHVERLADSDPRLGRFIREMAFETISRLEARALLLGRMGALKKVGLFLLELAERSPTGPLTRSRCRCRATTWPITSAFRSRR
jgi:CRP-like cAMP-binding protein